MKHRKDWFEGVATCKKTETLSVILERIVKAEVRGDLPQMGGAVDLNEWGLCSREESYLLTLKVLNF